MRQMKTSANSNVELKRCVTVPSRSMNALKTATLYSINASIQLHKHSTTQIWKSFHS